MRLRLASVLAAGLALSGCAGTLGNVSAFDGAGYPAQPYAYAYSAPYPEYGPVPPSYGYVAPYEVPPTFVTPFVYQGHDWDRRHDWDGRYQGDWAHRGGDWTHGAPRVWAGPPGGVHPAPPPTPHVAPPSVHAPDARTREFMNAVGFKPDR